MDATPSTDLLYETSNHLIDDARAFMTAALGQLKQDVDPDTLLEAARASLVHARTLAPYPSRDLESAEAHLAGFTARHADLFEDMRAALVLKKARRDCGGVASGDPRGATTPQVAQTILGLFVYLLRDMKDLQPQTDDGEAMTRWLGLMGREFDHMSEYAFSDSGISDRIDSELESFHDRLSTMGVPRQIHPETAEGHAQMVRASEGWIRLCDYVAGRIGREPTYGHPAWERPRERPAPPADRRDAPRPRQGLLGMVRSRIRASSR